MIGQFESKEINLFKIKISQASGGFLVFILLLISFLSFKKVTAYSELEKKELHYSAIINALNDSLKNSVQIADPRDLAMWQDARGVFEWFNPPLALAANEHKTTKTTWFDNPTFKLQILLIMSRDGDHNKIYFMPRIRNLKNFLNSLVKKHGDSLVLERVTVRIYTDNYIPTESFFTTNRFGEKELPHSIFYFPSKQNHMKPAKCIVSSSRIFNEKLHEEFESYWESARGELSLKEFILSSATESQQIENFIIQN